MTRRAGMWDVTCSFRMSELEEYLMFVSVFRRPREIVGGPKTESDARLEDAALISEKLHGARSRKDGRTDGFLHLFRNLYL